MTHASIKSQGVRPDFYVELVVYLNVSSRFPKDLETHGAIIMESGLCGKNLVLDEIIVNGNS
jgi:hypothetical protein